MVSYMEYDIKNCYTIDNQCFYLTYNNKIVKLLVHKIMVKAPENMNTNERKTHSQPFFTRIPIWAPLRDLP